MKRVMMRAVSLMACLMMMAAAVSAQTVMRVYVGKGAMEDTLARGLVEMLSREFPQAEFMLTDRREGDLRELVLGDKTPQLAICSPRETGVWAKEGLTLPLQRYVDDQEEMAREILSVCVQDEELFMLPLLAKHRQMAVNVKLFEKHALGYMLDVIAHPVWYPTEFQQILEEFAIAGETAMDLWHAEPENAAAIEAMLQAIYCGGLLGDDGKTCRADDKSVYGGMRWLRDQIEGEMIGYADTRQQALERFLAEETAIFADWTREMQQIYAKQMKEAGMVVKTRPYPSSTGLPVRHYELTGVSALDSSDEEKNGLALQAVVFLHENAQVQSLLENRAIFEDDSVWLWDLSASDRGVTLRSLMCGALSAVIEEGQDAEQALAVVKAGMDTAGMQ